MVFAEYLSNLSVVGEIPEAIRREFSALPFVRLASDVEHVPAAHRKQAPKNSLLHESRYGGRLIIKTF